MLRFHWFLVIRLSTKTEAMLKSTDGLERGASLTVLLAAHLDNNAQIVKRRVFGPAESTSPIFELRLEQSANATFADSFKRPGESSKLALPPKFNASLGYCVRSQNASRRADFGLQSDEVRVDIDDWRAQVVREVDVELPLVWHIKRGALVLHLPLSQSSRAECCVWTGKR